MQDRRTSRRSIVSGGNRRYRLWVPETEPDQPPADVQDFEDAFADAIRAAREERNLSQRQLAALLEERGLHLDPTIITRMENRASKKRRSIRLGEAVIIASALDIDLDALVFSMEPAEQRFATARRMANDRMNETRGRLSEWLDTLQYAQRILASNPSLVESLAEGRWPPPADPAHYLAWVSERLVETARLPWLNVVEPDDALRAQLQHLASAISSNLVVAEPPSYADLSVHTRTPADLSVWTDEDATARRNFDQAIIGYARRGASVEPIPALDRAIADFQKLLDEFSVTESAERNRIDLINAFGVLDELVNVDRNGILSALQTLYGPLFVDAFIHFDREYLKLEVKRRMEAIRDRHIAHDESLSDDEAIDG